MKNIFHAEMALLIRREKELEEKLRELGQDLGLWKERIELARRTDRHDLAGKAEQRLASIRQEAKDLRDELRLTQTKKKRVRYESRRPTGESVRRAEAMVENFRQSGLVDPDEATMQREFDELPQVQNKTARQTEPNTEPTKRSSKPEKSKPAPAAAADKADAKSKAKTNFDDLDLDDLENLDVDELERLIAGDEVGEY